MLRIAEEGSKAKSDGRGVQAWWKSVECGRSKVSSVTLSEHVKVRGPRVPARQTLDVGQDDLAGRVSAGGERRASALRTERQGDAVQHRVERESQWSGGAGRCSRRRARRCG